MHRRLLLQPIGCTPWPTLGRRRSSGRPRRLLAGFQGKDVVQITYREITDIKWLRRFGGAAGDLVLTLQDGAKVARRSPRHSPRRSPRHSPRLLWHRLRARNVPLSQPTGTGTCTDIDTHTHTHTHTLLCALRVPRSCTGACTCSGSVAPLLPLSSEAPHRRWRSAQCPSSTATSSSCSTRSALALHLALHLLCTCSALALFPRRLMQHLPSPLARAHQRTGTPLTVALRMGVWQTGDLLQQDCGYPDAPATAFLEKVKSGEEPPVELPAFEAVKVE